MSGEGRALVLFSGGQDSTTALAWALDASLGRDGRLRLRPAPSRRAGMPSRDPRKAAHACPRAMPSGSAPDHIVDLEALGTISDTALTRETRDRLRGNRPADDLRARAQPDLPDLRRRRSPIAATAGTSCLASARPIIPAIPIAAMTRSRRCRSRSTSASIARFVLHTPLMWRDKAQTFALARELGGAGAARPCRRGHA